MNKVMLMGNLTRDPEVRYSQSANPVAVARYGIAVSRRFVKQGETDVDFFNIVAFGKAAEFAEKYFRKGLKVVVVGHLQVNTWEDDQKNKRTSVDIIVEEQHFAESKASAQSRGVDTSAPISTSSSPSPSPASAPSGFNPTMDDDDDLPF